MFNLTILRAYGPKVTLQPIHKKNTISFGRNFTQGLMTLLKCTKKVPYGCQSYTLLIL